MIHRHTIVATITALAIFAPSFAMDASEPTIEVTGSATISIVPDRITVEIGMEEYYVPAPHGDSTIVRIPAIERNVRKVLATAGVPDSLIVVTDIGNYRNRDISADFLMGKKLSATVTDFAQIERISDGLERRGISCFNIERIDNSDIERYNRQGLKAALDAARDKAEFIAENENCTIAGPYEIVENGPNYYDTPTFSNVAFDSGSGMENMRRIVRRYSVKVRYLFAPKGNQPVPGKSQAN